MARGLVLDPTSTRGDDITSRGPDAGVLARKRIGIRVDRMWRAWDWISEAWADKLRAAGATGLRPRDRSAYGRSRLRVHALPHPLNERLRDEVLPIGESHFKRMLETMGARLAVRHDAA